jgi:hypothetical protein
MMFRAYLLSFRALHRAQLRAPADGNGAVVMSREKLTKSCTTVKPKSRATKCAITLFFSSTYLTVLTPLAGSVQGNTITRNARKGDPAVKIVREGVGPCQDLCCVEAGTESEMQNDVVKLAHELNEVKSGELNG